jgi:CRP-like cAMP-binding protein
MFLCIIYIIYVQKCYTCNIMSKNIIACDLKSCYVCRFCLKGWLPVIEVQKKNIEIKKGQHLFTEGEPVKGIFFVHSGKVKVHKQWGKEKELIVRFAQKGDIVGQLGLGSNSFYPVSATAIEPVVVCYLDMEIFESTLKVNNELTYTLMRFFADQLQESEKRMRNLAHMAVKGRVAQALIMLKNQFGINREGHIDIELTRQDLASYTGAVYESLFRTMNTLIREKLIEVTGKSITLLDETALLQLTAETNL